jgi:hypothetical protein
MNEDSERETSSDAPWLSEEAVAGLAESALLESQLHPDEDEETTARRLLRENVPTAVTALTHLMTHSQNERVRMDASKYVIDRVLGKIGDDAFGGDESPIVKFLSDVTSYVEAAS